MDAWGRGIKGQLDSLTLAGKQCLMSACWTPGHLRLLVDWLLVDFIGVVASCDLPPSDFQFLLPLSSLHILGGITFRWFDSVAGLDSVPEITHCQGLNPELQHILQSLEHSSLPHAPSQSILPLC